MKKSFLISFLVVAALLSGCETSNTVYRIEQQPVLTIEKKVDRDDEEYLHFTFADKQGLIHDSEHENIVYHVMVDENYEEIEVEYEVGYETVKDRNWYGRIMNTHTKTISMYNDLKVYETAMVKMNKSHYLTLFGKEKQ